MLGWTSASGGISIGIARARLGAVVAALAVAASLAGQPAVAQDGDAPPIWEYRTIFVTWDEEAQDWRADFSDGTSTAGLEAVLDNEGSFGWELADVAHERYDEVLEEGGRRQEARRLRLIFKREAAVAPPAASVVAISDFSFQPASLEITAGTTVTWENEDTASHTATSGDGTFDSGTLASGGTFAFTFDQAGTFDYACAIHPSMTGTIVVS